jgi:hypothetical protein
MTFFRNRPNIDTSDANPSLQRASSSGREVIPSNINFIPSHVPSNLQIEPENLAIAIFIHAHGRNKGLCGP